MSEDFSVDLTPTRYGMSVFAGIGGAMAVIAVGVGILALVPSLREQQAGGLAMLLVFGGVGLGAYGAVKAVRGPPLRLVVGGAQVALKHRKTGATLGEAPISELDVHPLVVEVGTDVITKVPGLRIGFPGRKRLVVITLDPRFSSQHEYEHVSESTHQIGRGAFMVLVDALKPGAWLPEVG